MNIPILGSRTVSLIGLVIGFMGCSGKHLPESGVTLNTRTDSVRSLKPTTPAGWFPNRVATHHRYTIEDSSRISINSDSTRSSAIETRTIYSIATTQLGDTLGFQAGADSIATTTHVPTLRTVIDTSLANDFRGAFAKNGSPSSLTSHRSTLCAGGINSVATRIFELTNSFPRNPVRAGDEWSDTVSMTTCRGKTPLIQQTIRHYAVIDIARTSIDTTVKIQRTAETQFTGESVDATNHLSITGTGSGTAILYLAIKSGDLLKSDGTSQVMLTIVTNRGTFPFSQKLITHITVQ